MKRVIVCSNPENTEYLTKLFSPAFPGDEKPIVVSPETVNFQHIDRQVVFTDCLSLKLAQFAKEVWLIQKRTFTKLLVIEDSHLRAAEMVMAQCGGQGRFEDFLAENWYKYRPDSWGMIKSFCKRLDPPGKTLIGDWDTPTGEGVQLWYEPELPTEMEDGKVLPWPNFVIKPGTNRKGHTLAGTTSWGLPDCLYPIDSNNPEKTTQQVCSLVELIKKKGWIMEVFIPPPKK